MSIYTGSIQEIDSSEARYKNVIFKNNTIIVPYINLGISNHPLHPENSVLKYLDYGYTVFKD